MAGRCRRCATCSAALPKDASPRRKYCDADCRRGKPKAMGGPLGSVASATEEALGEAARTQVLGRLDAGVVAALRVLARKIDTEQEVRDLALKAAEGGKPPPVDNVSIPTYLKYCESLGLTPSGRGKFAAEKGEQQGGQSKSKLASVSDIPRPA